MLASLRDTFFEKIHQGINALFCSAFSLLRKGYLKTLPEANTCMLIFPSFSLITIEKRIRKEGSSWLYIKLTNTCMFFHLFQTKEKELQVHKWPD